VTAFWFAPVARARVAWLRTVVYLFIPVDVLLTTSWVADHADVPGALYEPLFVGRILPLPTPGSWIRVLEVVLIVASVVAASGRLPRVLGTAVALLYFEWMVVAMSYGKVDHDRFAFLVALAVLPTVGAARWGDRSEDAQSGWAVRCIQVAVMLTYFLATFAKFRLGGLDWATGATLSRALLRRGTSLGDPLLDLPWLLVLTQWGIIAFELCSPVMLLRNRVGHAYVMLAVAFHLVTFATLTIIFLPHIVALLSFAPFERLAGRGAETADGQRVRARAARAAAPAS
jgi:hypothetical protein